MSARMPGPASRRTSMTRTSSGIGPVATHRARHRGGTTGPAAASATGRDQGRDALQRGVDEGRVGQVRLARGDRGASRASTLSGPTHASTMPRNAGP